MGALYALYTVWQNFEEHKLRDFKHALEIFWRGDTYWKYYNFPYDSRIPDDDDIDDSDIGEVVLL